MTIRSGRLSLASLIFVLLTTGVVDGGVLAHRAAGAATAEAPTARAVATRAPAPVVLVLRPAVLRAPRGPATPAASPARPAAPRPMATRSAAVPAVRQPAAHAARPVQAAPAVRTTPTGWAALDHAIAQIPSYHAGAAQWVVSSRYGHWGAAVLGGNEITIEPSVPTDRLYDVAVHEWSHVLSMQDYGNDVNVAENAMDAYFGASGEAGAEDAADCMAIAQGATWTHYTSCPNPHWHDGALRLLAGERL